MRIGIGYDVHRLVEGARLILGGVEIPFESGLLGHSDADVLSHAICDALFGAAAMGDIGEHFPDSDEKYRNYSSLEFLKETVRALKKEGFTLNNIDAVIIAEKPKLAPLIPKMRENIAETLDISIEQVSIKATTTEGLGFAGRGEGIAAQAVVSIVNHK